MTDNTRPKTESPKTKDRLKDETDEMFRAEKVVSKTVTDPDEADRSETEEALEKRAADEASKKE